MAHLSVMFAEALQQLAIRKEGIYLDATFGRGGHSLGILNTLSDQGRLLALDRDLDALASSNAQSMLKDSRFQLFHSRFSKLENVVEQQGLVGCIDGILLDLGVSSPQLDNPERGFSFLRDGLLDMRMDTSANLTAAQWLASVDESYLANVLFQYGEEKFSRRIAKAIVEMRMKTPINTTRQLAELCEQVVPTREKNKHPATRTFQAIRMEINHELDELTSVLQQAVRVLNTGGRLVVISFHSLEDRIVKRFIRDESGAKPILHKLPIKEAELKQVALKRIGKALTATTTEVENNPRSRSAVMRVAEKI